VRQIFFQIFPVRLPVARTPRNQPDPRQARFISAYIADPQAVGKNAAVAAGYSRKSAADAACRLLRNPMVKAAIDDARGEIMAHGKYSAEVAMSDLRRAERFAIQTENANALVRCHELMMRLHGLLIDKAQITLAPVDLGGTLIEARKRTHIPYTDYQEAPLNPFE